MIKIISSQPTTINAPLHHIIEQSTSINNLDLIKEFLELFRSSSKDGPTYSIQNYLDKSQNLQDVIFHYEELQRLINRLKYHGINRTEPLDQLCEHIRQNIVEKDYEIVFDGKPSDYDLILNLIHKYKEAGLELSTSTLQELKKTLDRNLSFRRYVQYSSMSSDVKCVTGQNLNQLVNRIKQHASEFKEILARLETSCSVFGFTIASPEIDNECQEMINEYFKHFINQVLASSKKNSLKITFEHFLTAVRFRQQYKLTVDFQPLFTSIFNRDRIKDITSIEDIEDFINIYIRNKSLLSVLPSHEQKLVQGFYNQLEEHINWLKNIDVDQILEEMYLLSPIHVDSKLYQRVFDLLELYKTKNNEVQLLPFEDTNKKRSCVKKELYLKIKNILKLDKEITTALTERGILPEADTFLSTLRNCEEKFSTLPELESHILKQLDYLIDNQKLVQRLIKNPDFPMKELPL